MSRAYSVRTVVSAQRRVLRMAADLIADLSARERFVLRSWGGTGVATLDEVREHAMAAAALQIREVKPKARKRRAKKGGR